MTGNEQIIQLLSDFLSEGIKKRLEAISQTMHADKSLAESLDSISSTRVPPEFLRKNVELRLDLRAHALDSGLDLLNAYRAEPMPADIPELAHEFHTLCSVFETQSQHVHRLIERHRV